MYLYYTIYVCIYKYIYTICIYIPYLLYFIYLYLPIYLPIYTVHVHVHVICVYVIGMCDNNISKARDNESHSEVTQTDNRDLGTNLFPANKMW
jgi:hypothetical protein